MHIKMLCLRFNIFNHLHHHTVNILPSVYLAALELFIRVHHSMKLACTMLKLAALAFAALIGSTSAGVMDGPCTISGDMTQVTGNCPVNTQNCLTSVSISPDSDNPGRAVVQNACMPSGLYSVQSTDNGNTAGYLIALDRTDTYKLGVAGSRGVVRVGIFDSNENELCAAPASVSGTCLYSDQQGGGSRSNAAAVGAAGVATALLAAAGVVAGNAQL